MEAVLHLHLPWRTLRSKLARLASDGSIEYLSCFEDLQIEKSNKEVSVAYLFIFLFLNFNVKSYKIL